ncbi:hypothetical protein UFOVP378_60 [uncultured Caudovirales phage]|uniref:ART-PolyVal-like domain-containing protein n=1 Tax=uncultured Caudovirales phage TaxID=2100421 RepID=A0A6J7X7A1_9CAUD|nr:hypothetical protein UFOVP378_60 [uncultured Caudovirales phage]
MDGLRATPYRSSAAGTANDLISGLLGYMRDPRRTQQMQGLAGLLESTGIPKTVERFAYGEPLTNIQQANVPTLRPETANVLMTLLPVPSGANRAAMAAGRAGERMAERVVPQVMERGGMPAGLLEGMSSRTVSPLTVYHGSPAKFEQFDPTKIGSGEGAQSYGYGHYVAEAPDVARDYQRRLAKESQASDLNTKMKLVDVGGKPLTSFNVDMDAALIDAAKAGKTEFVNLAESKKARWENLSQDQSYPFQDYAKQKVGAYNSLLDTAKKSDVDYTGTGMFYEIDLPDEQIARMLDYDKPLSQQPKVVQDALEKLGYKVDRSEVDQYSDALLDALMTDAQVNLPKQPIDLVGNEIYRKLGNPEQAAQILREAGVPGIRYLDQGSRGPAKIFNVGSPNADFGPYSPYQTMEEAQKQLETLKRYGFKDAEIQVQEMPQTSNFVVFPGNEDLLTILRRNNSLLD